MLLSSSALEAFAVFAEQRNFTRAAALLHLSQPSLHVKIAKLADTLGTPLYRRDGRSLVITEAGEQVAAHARSLQQNEHALLQSLGQPTVAAPLAIATGEGALHTILEPTLRAMSKSERLAMRFLTADAPTAVDLIQRGRADIGVAVLEEFPVGLARRRICRIGQQLVVPTNHRLAERQRISIADLEGERFVVPPTGRPHRLMLARALRDAEVTWEPGVEVSGWDTMLRMVALGFGIAIVNENVGIAKGLKAFPLRSLPTVEYHAFWQPETTRQSQINVFLHALIETSPGRAHDEF
jgi:LysR family transcriptional regulator, low CO2-responsive transcriptional regulator